MPVHVNCLKFQDFSSLSGKIPWLFPFYSFYSQSGNHGTARGKTAICLRRWGGYQRPKINSQTKTCQSMTFYSPFFCLKPHIWATLDLKASLSDCCVVPNDAWWPLGGFGVMPTPQNVQNAHVHGLLLWQMTEFFLHSLICPLEIICNKFQSCETILGL